MKYFVWKDPTGKPIGWLETDDLTEYSTAEQVTKEEYIILGGSPNDAFVEGLKYEIPLDKKLQAQQDRIEFLEDCIAEMAQVIYS